jgi:dihydropteroate synthase
VTLVALTSSDDRARSRCEALGALRARLDALTPGYTPAPALDCRGVLLPLGARTLVMGIVNVTPDSFSGDGVGEDPAAALARARTQLALGADILDLGGESTRPGAAPVPAAVELARVVPTIARLAREPGVVISVDTSKAEVARAALAAGAHVVNDVTGLRGDPALAGVVAEAGAAVVIMHMQGEPRTMQRSPTYVDVVLDVATHLAAGVELAVGAGIRRDRVVIDPGIGFGKTLEHNLELLRRLAEFRLLGQPLLLGTSRKTFIGRLLGDAPPAERVEGTGATVALAIAAGVDIVRVHDVGPGVRVVRVADAIVRGTRADAPSR